MASKAPAIPEGRRIASSAGLDLALPECEKGIGAVISIVNSPI